MVSIRAAKPAVKPYKIGCGYGLFLLVNPNGSKLWRFKYRFEGREKVLTFGAYPLVSLLDARMQRDAAKLQLLKGIDPAQARKKQEIIRFEAVAEQWYQANAVAWATSTAKKVRIYLDKDILPTIGRHAIQSLQRGDLISLLDRVESREAFNVAGKMRNWLSGIFDEAVRQGLIADNPAMNLKLGIKARGRMVQHNATVSLAELGALFVAIDVVQCKLAYKLAIRLILLTACRPGELRLASWNEFDLDNALWTIPASRMKMRRQHVIPLSPQALSIARQMKDLAGSGSLVLPGRGGDKPITDMTLNMILKRAGYAGRQTCHGLRHFFSTVMNERKSSLGIDPDWIEAALSHQSDNKIRAVYNHATYLPERARLMELWAEIVISAGVT